MDIGSALKRTGREDITLRSMIGNIVRACYSLKFQKDIDILSVQIRGKKILIKTGNNLLNAELLYISQDIINTLIEKNTHMKLPLAKDIQLCFIV